MHISVRPEPFPVVGDIVITISGDLDRSTAPALRSRLEHLQGTSRAALTIDLARTDFVDAGGLHVLTSAALRACASGTPLRLVGCTRQTLRIIRIAEVDTAFGAVMGRGEPVAAGCCS